MIPLYIIFANLTDNFSGLKADEKAITAQELSVTIVSTGSAVIYGESIVEILESTPSTLQTQVHDYMKNTDLKVIKIGAADIAKI